MVNKNTLTGKSRALVLSVVGTTASEAILEEAGDRSYDKSGVHQ